MLLEYRNYPFYWILDQETLLKKGFSLFTYAQVLLDHGMRIFQYRDKISSKKEMKKNIERLLKIFSSYKALLIINDYEEIARKYALPLHIGQDVESSPSIPFGRSTHNKKEILKAIKENPSPQYLSLGACFPSFTKPEVEVLSLSEISSLVSLWRKEWVFIGGITKERFLLLPRSSRYFYAFLSDPLRSEDLPSLKKYLALLISVYKREFFGSS